MFFLAKKSIISLILLGLTVIFSYLYTVNNEKYMPKNKLFKFQNFTSKNHSFYRFAHFIFQNAFPFHFETMFSNLSSAPNICRQKKLEQLLQPQS